eukprot:8639959-Pyramimonas_sp.AAC.1
MQASAISCESALQSCAWPAWYLRSTCTVQCSARLEAQGRWSHEGSCTHCILLSGARPDISPTRPTASTWQQAGTRRSTCDQQERMPTFGSSSAI